MAHFFVFSADGSKKLVKVWAKYLNVPKDLLEFFQKIVRLVGFRVTVCEISRVETQKAAKSAKPCIVQG